MPTLEIEVTITYVRCDTCDLYARVYNDVGAINDFIFRHGSHAVYYEGVITKGEGRGSEIEFQWTK